MELKKIAKVILAIVLLSMFSTPVISQETYILSLRRISVTMPEITVEVTGSGYVKDEVSASLESENLSVIDVVKYDNTVHSTCAYILVDLSTSMNSSFDLVKKNVVSYIESMDENDKVILITFGEKEVKTLLNGNETRDDAIEVVKDLKCNEKGTLFYEALSQAYQLSNSSVSAYDREYVIAFSDGIDKQKGGTTFDEVLKQYDNHVLPLYAACSYNTSQDAADRFGELARGSGGDISIVKTEDAFGDFLTEINDVTLIKLKAATNHADGKEKQLSLKIGSSQIEYNVPIVRSIADTQAPEVDELYYDADREAFVITFTEKVLGAESTSAYKIVDPKGNKAEISNVFYSESDNIYEIRIKDTLCAGSYTVEFSGIKDNSKEANPLVGKKTVDVDVEITVTESVETSSHESVETTVPEGAVTTAGEDNIDIMSENEKNEDDDAEISAGIIILVVVGMLFVIAAIILLIVFSSKKKDPESRDDVMEIPIRHVPETVDHIQSASSESKHHIRTNDAIRIRLNIKTGRTSEQNIETSIVSSLIVGRSDTCDIYIDDTKLSRQHFVIEHDNGNIYIMDLQSRNGTMLNGIRITGRQRLNNGDKILAGLSDIIITVIGR